MSNQIDMLCSSLANLNNSGKIRLIKSILLCRFEPSETLALVSAVVFARASRKKKR